MACLPMQKRFVCSELVTVCWTPAWGPARETVANLESIWNTGAEISSEVPIAENALVRIKGDECEWRGIVRWCRDDEKAGGYIIEVEFLPQSRWSQRRYIPQHLFDPSVLLGFPTLLAS